MIIKKQNLHNEYKGNLFEFLVGQQLARRFGPACERRYVEKLAPSFRERLRFYEQELRQHDLALLKQLPLLAEKTVNAIHPSFKELKNPSLQLVGKITGGSGDDRFHEADLLINDSPVSLKLCKSHSFVNTKNAGVQSVIAKYFLFADAFTRQQEINDCLELSFQQMMKDISPLESTLPGELPPAKRERIFLHYAHVIGKIYQVFKDYQQEDSELFVRSLYPLCGFGDPAILQIKCFHGPTHEWQGLHFLRFADLVTNAKNARLDQLKKGVSSFTLELSPLTLQIRVKPMNRVNVMGLKVNCSIRF